MLTHDLNLYIQIEVVLDITHHLLTYMDSFQQINMVMSHPQALAQCRHFLETNLPHAAIIETNSTAEAVHAITLDKKGNAAIGSPDCHFRYNVPVKAENIGDYPHNQTRFFILGRSRNEPSIKNRKMDNNYINTGNNDNTQQDIQKTSLVVYPKGDRPGELYNILGMFLRYNINLSKVESRPVKRELGKYLFLIDCLADPLLLDDAINELNEITAGIKNLGSYQVLL
jgi:prephenate dehydratase